MASYFIQFIRQLRQSPLLLTSYSSIARSRPFLKARCQPVKKVVDGLEPLFRSRVSNLQWKLCAQRKFLQNLCFSGNKLSKATVFSTSVVIGSISYRPRVLYSINDHDGFFDDHHMDLDSSESEENRQAFWSLVRKLWVPILFFLTVLTNMDHPAILITTKILLFLLSTRPSPLSVYIFVDQLCHHSMRQEPHLYKIKSLYANKVEVQDYKFFCLARVEVRNQSFVLLGILSGWWSLPFSRCREALSLCRNSLPINYYDK